MSSNLSVLSVTLKIWFYRNKTMLLALVQIIFLFVCCFCGSTLLMNWKSHNGDYDVSIRLSSVYSIYMHWVMFMFTQRLYSFSLKGKTFYRFLFINFFFLFTVYTLTFFTPIVYIFFLLFYFYYHQWLRADNKLSSCLCAIKMWVIVSNPKKMQNNAVNMDIKKRCG